MTDKTEAIQTPIRAKFSALPGFVRMALIAGGAIVGITLISGVLSTLIPKEDKTVQPLNLVQPDQAAPSPSPTAATDLEMQRQTAWEGVKQSREQLLSSLSEIDTALRISRAQKWQIFAAQQCQQAGANKCPSSYKWLLDKYTTAAADIQREMFAGRVSVDAETVSRLRQKRDELMDLAIALSLDVNGNSPQPYILTQRFSGNVEDVLKAGLNFESLRQAAAMQAYEGQQQQQGGQQK
jgi:hypothetical protein